MKPSLRSISIRLAFAVLAAGLSAHATTDVGPWVPIFKGVDYSLSTNIPGSGDFPRLQVVHAFRVDLTDPDIRLFTTPPHSNYVAGSSEVGGLTTSEFLSTYHLQAAISGANFFSPSAYYLPAWTPMDVFGLAISEGVVVSTQDGPNNAAALLFDTNYVPTIIRSNWPAVSTNGVFIAVSGNVPLVIAGQNVVNQPNSQDLDPRTIYGLSQDRRFLYLVGIDGRQDGYSDGANFDECARWLLLLGAYDGINVDGGGSTLLVMEDSTGFPVRLSKSNAVADSGRERTVGGHFGIYAKPVPGFINDVVALPGDTNASVTWTTVQPSTTEVEYGLTTAFGNSTGVQTNLVTNHVVQLTGLTPWTGYYFRAISTTAAQQYFSSNFYFFTTNYVATNEIFGITNSWKYTNITANLNGLAWTGANYSDSAWRGPGAGLLWIDTRAGGPNPDVQPKSTQLPGNPNNNGRPYVTYYFRTHFTLTNVVPGGLLSFAGHIDDGAVFYINGAEIYRLRMPTNLDASTLATNFPCAGDATTNCLDTFTIAMDSLTNLVAGDNVLAVEVHNYNVQSSDITFGLSLQRIEPVAQTNSLPTITTQPQNLTVTNGDNASFTVVAGGNPAPTYQWRKSGTNISGATSPTYGINGVTTNDAGGYDVLVANSSGSVTSVVATLTVVVSPANSLPTITTQPQNLTVTNGDNASFTVVASGNPAPTYQWRKSGTNISGATTPTYGISGVTTNDAGGYDVVVANSSGSVTSVVAMLTVVVPSARIDLSYSGNTITLSWDAPGFVLQTADSLDGFWTNVAGNPVSPFPVQPLESNRFYRLRR